MRSNVSEIENVYVDKIFDTLVPVVAFSSIFYSQPRSIVEEEEHGSSEPVTR